MTLRICFLFMTLFVLTGIAHAQDFLRTEGKQIVDATGAPYRLQAINLGGWMVQEGYMMKTSGFADAQHQIRERVVEVVGDAGAEQFYRAWRANHVREADIELIRQVGFNAVRLPMHYNLYTPPIEEEPVAGEVTFLETGFALTDSLVSWCRAHDLYIILDLHAAPGGQGNEQSISDRDEDRPSLWESEANRDKTVALWQELARRYANEPIIAGYDLINEVNYELGPDNAPLRALYEEITDSIRSVDTTHMIIIEGNGFANDYRGLTPPWDDNMVYSPHKYWNYNDVGAIQYALDLREEHSIPIWFGETGENSNVWFRDAARLFDQVGVGWAWWPWKKIDDIAGPVSATLNPGYRVLLDYWSGNGPKPSAEEGLAALLRLAENMKLENARFQPGVTDALFRQSETNETISYIPHVLPGTIYAVDYDLGTQGYAYADEVVASYQSVTGEFTPWNSGFTYRNDGVDIERSSDTELTNGFNVGYTSDGEWLQYTIDVLESGVYEAAVRVATPADGSKLHFRIGETPLGEVAEVPNTGGYQDWQTLNVPNLALSVEDEKLRLYVDVGNFNVGGMVFRKTGELDSVTTTFVSGQTQSDRSFVARFNKPLDPANTPELTDFRVRINGAPGSLTAVSRVADEPRSLRFTVATALSPEDTLILDYSGDSLVATDGSVVASFADRVIENRVGPVFNIPGRLEVEDYVAQRGVRLETTSDADGGQNIGFLDVGDFLDYYVDVARAGTYNLNFRVASQAGAGAMALQLVDTAGVATSLDTVRFGGTGGWQSWQDFSSTVTLPAGRQQLRLLVTAPQFNLNYIDFDLTTSLSPNPGGRLELRLYPNPTEQTAVLSGQLPPYGNLSLRLMDARGRRLIDRTLAVTTTLDERLDLSALPAGSYLLLLSSGGNPVYRTQLIKQ